MKKLLLVLMLGLGLAEANTMVLKNVEIMCEMIQPTHRFEDAMLYKTRCIMPNNQVKIFSMVIMNHQLKAFIKRVTPNRPIMVRVGAISDKVEWYSPNFFVLSDISF